MLEADPRDLLHFFVRRISAEVRRDDRVVAEHLGNQRVGAAAERRREDRSFCVDDVDIALTLIRAELIDFLLEVGIVDGEYVGRQIEATPAWIVAVEAALEVAGNR